MTTSNEKEINPATTSVELNPMITVDGFKLKKLSVITTFSDTTKIDKAIAKFRKDALSVVPDLTTKKGRDAIASIAYKISKKKTNIVGQMVDPSIEEAKTLVKNVNNGKKHFQSEMDGLRDEVRKPLNEWEAAEKIKEEARIKAINERIDGIHAIATFDPSNPPGKDEIASLMEAVDSIVCEEGFDEFTQDALQAKNRVKEALTERLNAIIQQELKEEAEEEMRLKELELQQQQVKQQAQERVNKLMMIPVSFFGKGSVEIRKKITSLENYEVKDSQFGELTDQAKASVTTVVSQLSSMLQQQLLVEETQAKVYLEEQAKDNARIPCDKNGQVSEENKYPNDPREPVEGLITNASQSLPEESKPLSKMVTTQLTPHQKMIKEVNFWAGEYGVVNSEYSDLMNILNKYK